MNKRLKNLDENNFILHITPMRLYKKILSNIIKSFDLSFFKRKIKKIPPKQYIFDQYPLQKEWNCIEPCVSNIEVAEVLEKWKNIEIIIFCKYVVCLPWDPNPETWEIPNVMYRRYHKKRIICEWIHEYINKNNIKKFTYWSFSLSKDDEQNIRYVYILDKWKLEITIISEKVYLDEQVIDGTYSMDEKWHFIPFRNKNTTNT